MKCFLREMTALREYTRLPSSLSLLRSLGMPLSASILTSTITSWAIIWLLLALAATASADGPSVAQQAPSAAPTPAATPPPYWPTNGWRTSTPEQQGMDSGKLLAMVDDIEKQGKPVHGIVIIRNGHLVTEAYFPPYQANYRHYLASVTKSFTSALLGIAIQQGYIDGVDHKLLDLLPERTFANADARKRSITLEHLLTMSSGLDWPTIDLDERLFTPFFSSKDGIQFVLDRPMAGEPGTKFNYNSATSHVLSAVVQKATGMSSMDFAKKNLFAPLGITDVLWSADPNGINTGGWGLEMTPRDMAKFGFLYLNNGIWDGKAIVPAKWVQTSGAAHIDTQTPLVAPLYGYQWWVDSQKVYKASGSGGQKIFVIPDESMVVVFLGDLLPSDAVGLPEHYLYAYILPAVQPTTSSGTEQAALLAARLAALSNPAPKPVPPLPALASTVSGKLYTLLQPSPMGIKGLEVNFEQDQALIKAYFMMGSQQLAVGLDDVYRYTPVNVPGITRTTIALKGSWTSADTFTIYMFGGNSISKTDLFFKEDTVYMTTTDATGSQTIEGVVERTYPMLSPTNASAGQHPYSAPVQIEAVDRTTQTVQVNYLLYLPEDYGKDTQKKWPLMLFLHGIGERGVDVDVIKKHPMPKILEQEKNLPMIVVSPQRSLKSESWSDMIAPLNALLDQLQTTLLIDPQRIYLTGLSMGGAGTWEFGLRYPERFAAIAPVAGFYQYGSRVVPWNLCDLKGVPTWAFHGVRDTDVPSFQSEVLTEGLKACGGNVRLTLYPDADHEGAFYRAYGDPELYQWLLAQRKP